jgi:hypothetical protein
MGIRSRIFGVVGSGVLLLTMSIPVLGYTPAPPSDPTLFDVMDRITQVETAATTPYGWSKRITLAKNALYTLIDFREDGDYPKWAHDCKMEFGYFVWRGLRLSRAELMLSRAERTGYDSYLDPVAARVLLRANDAANLRELKDAREDLELCLVDHFIPFIFLPFFDNVP